MSSSLRVYISMLRIVAHCTKEHTQRSALVKSSPLTTRRLSVLSILLLPHLFRQLLPRLPTVLLPHTAPIASCRDCQGRGKGPTDFAKTSPSERGTYESAMLASQPAVSTDSLPSNGHKNSISRQGLRRAPYAPPGQCQELL